MNKENDVNLAKFRLEQAHECLRVAEINMEISLKNSVNRSYYCVFHAMRAVLALDRFDSKKHSGVISEFRKRYIKTGKLPKHLSAIIKETFQIRGDSDYEDFYVVAESEARQQYKSAKEFLEVVEEYVLRLLETKP